MFHRLRRRPSPAAAIAGVALFVALSGTAIAAGELITRADQIAPGVIDGNHIRPHSVARTDVQHPTLRLRVTSNGGLFGDPGDGTVQRNSFGIYFVTFNRDAIDGGIGGPRNARWLDDCAVVATPRAPGVGDGSEQGATLAVLRGATSSVVVVATKPDYELGRAVFRDTPFEIAAIC